MKAKIERSNKKVCLFLLLSASGAKTKRGLESVIDPPLKTSQSTDHQNTSGQTHREQTAETDVTDNGTHAATLCAKKNDE